MQLRCEVLLEKTSMLLEGDNLEASEKIRDYEVFGDKSNKNIYEMDLNVQPLDENPNVAVVSSSENLSDRKTAKNKKKKIKKEDKKATIFDEVQSIDPKNIKEGLVEDLVKGNETEKENKKRKRKKEKVKDEVQSLNQNNLYTGSTENLAEGNVTMEKPEVNYVIQAVNQTRSDRESTGNPAGGNVAIKNPKSSDEVQSTDHEMDMEKMESFADRNVSGKVRKKRKGRAKLEDEVLRKIDARSAEDLSQGTVTTEKSMIKDYVQKISQTKTDTRMSENLAEGNVTMDIPKIKAEVQSVNQIKVGTGSKENPSEDFVTIRNLKVLDEVERMGHSVMDTRPTKIYAEGRAMKKRKNKRKNKASNEDEVQREMDARSTENLSEWNVIGEKPKINVEVQRISQTKVDTGLTENISEGNVTSRNREVQDEVQSMDQTVVDRGPTENYAEGHVTKTRKKKRKKKKKNEDELERRMDTRSTECLAEENVTVKKPKIKVEVQSISQTKVDIGPTENLSEGTMTFRNREVQDEVQNTDQNVMDTGPTEYYAEGHVTKKRKKKRKNKKNNEDELQREMSTRSSVAEGNVTVKKPKLKDEVQSGSPTKVDAENVTIRNQEVRDEVQSLGQTIMDTEQTEGHVTKKGKKKRKNRQKNEDAVQREMNTRLTEDLAEGNVMVEKPKIKDEVQSISQTKLDTGPTENVSEGNVAVRNREVQDEVQSMGQTTVDAWPTKNYAEGQVTKKIKKKRKSKEKNYDEVPSEMDIRSRENLAEGYVTIKKPKIKDKVQSISQKNVDTRSRKNFAEGDATIKDIKIQDEAQNMDPIRMDSGPTEISAVGNVAGKRKKKQKSKVRIKDEVHSIVDTRSTKNLALGNVFTIPKIKDEVQSFENKMDTGLTDILSEGNVNIRNPKIQDEAHIMDGTKMNKGPREFSAEGRLIGRSRKKQKGTRMETKHEVPSKMDTRATENLAENANTKKAEIEDEVQSVGLTKMDACSTESLLEGNVTVKDQKLRDKAESMDQIKIDGGPKENSAEGNGTGKRDKKRKCKAKIKDDIQSYIDTRTENIADVNAITQEPNIKDVVQSIGQKEIYTCSIEFHAEGNVTIKDPKIHDEAHSMGQSEMDTGPTANFVEGNVTVKSKKKRKRTDKAKTNDEVPNKMHKRLTENLVEANAGIKKSEIDDGVEGLGLTQMDTGSAENLAIGYAAIKNPKLKDEVQILENSKPSMGHIRDFSEGNVSGKREKKQKRKKKAKTEGEFISMELETKPLTCKSEHMSHRHLLEGQKGKSQNGLSEVRNEVILDMGKGYAEETSAISSYDFKVTSSFSSFSVKDAKGVCPKAAPVTSIRRKLLVLDLNGLLADVVFPAPKQCCPDFKFFGRAIFKRPFCDDFLKFCFQNFDVGIWSSRNKKVVDKVVEYLLGDLKDKLLFCWDMQYATQTGFKTLENMHKPLVCKELKKIWQNDDPNLPWKKGNYDEFNTLLLDDSPFKALLNPLHTAIFPHPYQHSDKNDDSLGPGGALRVYLEGLAKSENVQKYVEQHPFGQKPITEENISWDFYSRVLHQMTTPAKCKTPISDTSKAKNPISNPVEDKT